MAGRETCPPSQLPTPATAETRAVPHGTPLSVSSWDHVQLHPMGNSLGSCLWRGQQRFDEDNLSPFQESSRREAWGGVHACPTRSPFPAMRVVMERGMLLSDPADAQCNSWRSQPSGGCPFWGKLWLCMSQVEQAHGNLPTPHSKIRSLCCQILTAATGSTV